MNKLETLRFRLPICLLAVLFTVGCRPLPTAPNCEKICDVSTGDCVTVPLNAECE